MIRQIGCLLFFLIAACTLSAQDTLPKFTVVDKGNNRILSSWVNTYGRGIRQLSIQRSFDSTRNFRTILTLPDPTIPQNGYVDAKAPNNHMFYRLFILLDSGKYIFSTSKRPGPDTKKTAAVLPESSQAATVMSKEERAPANEPPAAKETPKEGNAENSKSTKPKEIPERIIYVKRRDSLITQIGEKSYRRFRDSMLTKSKDTLSFSTPDTLIIRPFVPKVVYKPSIYVFTARDGNVKLSLPDAATKHYALKFFEMDDTPVLDIRHIAEDMLIIDKTNFLHAGWFKFELYEDGHIKERHKLFIPKEF